MNISKYRFKSSCIHILFSCLVILGIGWINIDQAYAEETAELQVYTKGNLQRGFGVLTTPLTSPAQLSKEFHNIIESGCGSANGVENSSLCITQIERDPICTAIKDNGKEENKNLFTECVQLIAYKHFKRQKFSSFRYEGSLPFTVQQIIWQEIKQDNSDNRLETIFFPPEPVKDADMYNGPILTKTVSTIPGTDATAFRPFQFPDNSYIDFISGKISGGYYKTYWEGCKDVRGAWGDAGLTKYKNTIFCYPAPGTTVNLYLEFPNTDYSQATLLLCQNPERANDSSKPAYSNKCLSDIIQNCFFADEAFDLCASKYRTSPTSLVTQPQIAQLTTDYCRKYLLSSESGGIPAYQNCIKNSAKECSSHNEIQAYAQCIKRVAHQIMTSVGLCLAGEPTDEKVCSKNVCTANSIPQCSSAQSSVFTSLATCTANCPSGETLCKGPITGAINSTSAPKLLCYKPAAGQRPAAPAAGTGRAPAVGANLLANCYACKNKAWGTIDPDGDLNSTNPKTMSKETCEKIGGEDAVWATAGTSTKPPASCPTEAATEKYACAVCNKGLNDQNQWIALGDPAKPGSNLQLKPQDCLDRGEKDYKGTARVLKPGVDTKTNSTDYRKSDYCPAKGPIGKQTTRPQGAAVPVMGNPEIIGCKVNADGKIKQESSSVYRITGVAKVNFNGTTNKGFDRVNWYLGTSADSLEFKGTNDKVSGETTFGGADVNYKLTPNNKYFVQAEFYTQEGNDKREALPCAPDDFIAPQLPWGSRQAIKFDANPAQAVLGTATGPYTVGFYVKAGSEDVTELNVDVKAYGRGGGDASGAISLENAANGTARNGSVVRVKIVDPSQVEKLVVTTSYTFEGNLFPGATATMYLNRLDDSQPVPESELQKTTLKPLDVQTITISPAIPTSTGFVLVRTTSTTSLGNWKIQVANKDGAITKGDNADALTAGCENNAGGVCTYQANFSQLPEGEYEAELLSEGNVKASAKFSVVGATLDPNGNPITPNSATELLPGQTNTADTVIIDLVKLSCSTRNSESADGEYVIFQDGSSVRQTIAFPENVTQDTCSLTRYANGNSVDTSVIRFKVGAREEPTVAPGAPPPTGDGSKSDDAPPCNEGESWENQGYMWCNEGQKRKCTVEKNLCTGALRNEYGCEDRENTECGGSSSNDGSTSDPDKCSSDSTVDSGDGTFRYCNNNGVLEERRYCWGPTEVEGSQMWGNPNNSCLRYDD